MSGTVRPGRQHRLFLRKRNRNLAPFGSQPTSDSTGLISGTPSAALSVMGLPPAAFLDFDYVSLETEALGRHHDTCPRHEGVATLAHCPVFLFHRQ